MRRKVLIKQFITAIATIFIIVTINFSIINSMPGDPIINIIGEEEYYKIKNTFPEVLEQIKGKYGLNEPLHVRYLKYIKNIVTFDFGYSYTKSRPVIDIIAFRIKWTLILTIPATIIAAVIGGILGVIAGWRRGKIFDRIATPLALFLNTIPTNCIAIIMLSIFSYKLGWFPISGMTSGGLQGAEKTIDIVWHMVLPVTVIVISRTSSNFINMKSYVSKIKDEEYILTAVSKGLSKNKVLRRHVLINCILPYITLIFMQFGHIVSGSIIVETIFSWVGMGKLMNESMTSSDFPIMQLCFLITAVCAVVANLLVDMLAVLVDPRLKEAS